MKQQSKLIPEVVRGTAVFGTLLIAAACVSHWMGSRTLPRVEPLFAYAALASAVFFALAASVYFPLLSWLARRSSVGVLAFAGAMLAILPLTAIAIFGGERATLLQLLEFWRRLPGELLVTLVPLAASGASMAYRLRAGSTTRPDSALQRV